MFPWYKLFIGVCVYLSFLELEKGVLCILIQNPFSILFVLFCNVPAAPEVHRSTFEQLSILLFLDQNFGQMIGQTPWQTDDGSKGGGTFLGGFLQQSQLPVSSRTS